MSIVVRVADLQYHEAIQWLFDFDDIAWLNDDSDFMSPCAYMVADIYHRLATEVTEDLRIIVIRGKHDGVKNHHGSPP